MIIDILETMEEKNMKAINVEDKVYDRIKNISAKFGIKVYKIIELAIDAYDKKSITSSTIDEIKKSYDIKSKQLADIEEKYKQLSINYKAVCDKLQNIKKAVE